MTDLMPAQDKAWVLTWRYSDGSGSGVERVYVSRQRAEADLALILVADSARQWSVAEVQLIRW